jgi:hypothetical protein
VVAVCSGASGRSPPPTWDLRDGSAAAVGSRTGLVGQASQGQASQGT